MNETSQSLERNQQDRNRQRMSNTEGSEGRDMEGARCKATTLSPEVVVEGKERMINVVLIKVGSGCEEHESFP